MLVLYPEADVKRIRLLCTVQATEIDTLPSKTALDQLPRHSSGVFLANRFLNPLIEKSEQVLVGRMLGQGGFEGTFRPLNARPAQESQDAIAVYKGPAIAPGIATKCDEAVPEA